MADVRYVRFTPSEPHVDLSEGTLCKYLPEWEVLSSVLWGKEAWKGVSEVSLIIDGPAYLSTLLDNNTVCSLSNASAAS